jgi:hypothetical protein
MSRLVTKAGADQAAPQLEAAGFELERQVCISRGSVKQLLQGGNDDGVARVCFAAAIRGDDFVGVGLKLRSHPCGF